MLLKSTIYIFKYSSYSVTIMKGPFSIWAVFGLTIVIDLLTHVYHPKKYHRINPYNPVREVSLVVPVHKEPTEYIEETILSLNKERYPLKNIIVCGDLESKETEKVIKKLSEDFKNLFYLESPYVSKARKINYTVENSKDILGEFVYVRDCRVTGEIDCIEKMVSYFSHKSVSAVTSYGRVSIPRNFLSRSYFYGKTWINEVGRFRKNAQEKRRAVFVICGASTMFRTDVLKKIPIPHGSKTEDTHYTWLLQEEGYNIRVADDATVSSPEIDGPGLEGIKLQIKQSYRWSTGTMQCLFRERERIFKSKRLAYSTLLPGFLESLMYTIPLILLPLFFFIYPVFALGFLIGDTVFSLLGTLIIIPKKFPKTLFHYPQILFFKYLNAIIFLCAIATVTTQAAVSRRDKWYNEWFPPRTKYEEI